MKSIQLNGVMYKMPTSWDDVTLKQQIEISKIVKNNTGNTITNNLALISGYAGIPMEVLKSTHINKLPKLMKHLDFITQEMDTKPITEFDHKGNTYHVIESLIKGEFQDFISLESIIQQYKDNSYAGLPMMIAVLAKREGESLDDYDIEERAKEFVDLPIVIANKMSVFFSQLAMVSSLNTQISSEMVEEETALEMIRRFEELESITKPQVGQGLLTRLRMKMSRNYVASIEKNWNLSLTSTPLKSSKINTIQTWKNYMQKLLKI